MGRWHCADLQCCQSQCIGAANDPAQLHWVQGERGAYTLVRKVQGMLVALSVLQ